MGDSLRWKMQRVLRLFVAPQQHTLLARRALSSKPNMALIKELRERSGAGVAACKRAVEAANGDLDAAFDELRKEGLAAAAKKASRVAAEGLVALSRSDDGKSAVVIELNSETDFVSRNEAFVSLAESIAKSVHSMDGLQSGDISVEALGRAPLEGASTVNDVLAEMVGKMGENITLRRGAYLHVENGVVGCYVHGKVGPSSGRLATVIGVDGDGAEQTADIAGQFAMHIAAARPRFLDRGSVDTQVLEHETSILTEQARAEGKPEKVIGNMVKGRLNKFFSEVVLLDQEYLCGADEDKITVSKLLKKHSDAVGTPLSLTGFECYACGEGIEKKADNFVDEVASMASQ